jgi:hypothetical protein
VTVYGRHDWEGPAETTDDGLQLRAVAPSRDLYTDNRRSIYEALEFAASLWNPLRRHIDDHDLLVASGFPYSLIPMNRTSIRVVNIGLFVIRGRERLCKRIQSGTGFADKSTEVNHNRA